MTSNDIFTLATPVFAATAMALTAWFACHRAINRKPKRKSPADKWTMVVVETTYDVDNRPMWETGSSDRMYVLVEPGRVKIQPTTEKSKT